MSSLPRGRGDADTRIRGYAEMIHHESTPRRRVSAARGGFVPAIDSSSYSRGCRQERIVEQFASGLKEHYYGKGDVIVYRLRRDGQVPEGTSPMFGANVLMLVYGGSFWPTYAMGDNTGLIATDSMKNFIQRETLGFTGQGFEDYCRFLGQKFLDLYPQVEGIQVSAEEIPYTAIGGPALVPSGPDRAHARLELNRERTIEVVSGLRGFKLLRLGGSTFYGFLRDEYTTLPDIKNRALHMWLDLKWSYTS